MKPTEEGMGDEAMKKSLFYRAKKMPPSAQIMLLFAVEGVFLQYITSINGFGLNPVSYTHLDVYKRQSVQRGAIRWPAFLAQRAENSDAVCKRKNQN